MMGDDCEKNARRTIRLCSALLPVSYRCGGESEARRKPVLAEAEFLAHGSNIDYGYPFNAHHGDSNRNIFSAGPCDRLFYAPDESLWNIQVGGASVAPGAERPPMVQAALSSLFAGTYQILAAQEIASTDSAQFLRTLLPGGTTDWQASFFNTSDTTDNGFWYRTGITLRDSFPLFVTNQMDSAGRIIADPS